MPRRGTKHICVASAVALVHLFASFACVGLGDLTGGDAPPSTACGPDQERVNDGCYPRADGGGIVKGPAGCPAGYQDDDGDAICHPSCMTATLSCGPHGACGYVGGAPACVCATGYVREGDACVWRGGLRDPGFQNQPAGVWSLLGGVTIDATADGGVDLGRAVFAGPIACARGAGVAQRISMPTPHESEPFALELFGPSSGNSAIGFEWRLAGITGDTFTASTQGSTQRACLGERAYGPNVDFEVRPRESAECDDNTILALDRAAIVTAPTCPAAGIVPNGNFEGNGVWTSVAGGGGAVAEVAIGAGTSASRAGHLATTTTCQMPTLSADVSPPWKSVDRAALSFSFKGSPGDVMTLTMGRVAATIGQVRGNATFQAARLCVREDLKGFVSTLRFGTYNPPTACTPRVRDFIFDDLTFVSDPSCPPLAYVSDGGFENSAVASPWILDTPSPHPATAVILTGAMATPHTGAAHLQLGVYQACARATGSQTITVPPAAGAAGPAIKFWYRLPTVANATFSVFPGGVLPVAAAWTQRTVCLSPSKSGKPELLFFDVTMGSGGGACGASIGNESLSVDDVEVGTDPSCPAQ